MIKSERFNLFNLIIISIVTVLSFSFFAYHFVGIVNAIGGRPFHVGFFGGRQYSNDPGWDIIPGGVDAGSKEEFIAKIKAIYAGGTGEQRMGAAYVIQTMTPNIDGSYNYRYPSASDIAEWESRIRSNNIRMSRELYSSNVSSHRRNWTGIPDGNGDNGSQITDVMSTASYDGSKANLSLVFYDVSNSMQYVVNVACANPAGDFIGIKESWSVAGSTTVTITDKAGKVKSGTVAAPGDTVSWNHRIDQKGLDPTKSSQIHYNLGIDGFDNWPPSNVEPGAGDIMPVFEAYGYRENLGSNYAKYTVKSTDIGRKLCERIQYDPINSWGGHDGRGEWKCVTVAGTGSYSLSATSTVNQSTAIPGNSIVWQHSVINNGPDATTEPVRSYISPSGFSSSVDTKDLTVAKGIKGVVRNFNSDTYIVKDSDIGKTICQSVAYNAVGVSQSGSSTPACVTIKSPANSCRPIQTYTVPPRTYYGASTHYDPKGRSYPIPAVSIPTVATVGGSTVYTNSTTNPYTLDKAYATNYITTAYTDGNSHTISYSEAYSHIGGYIDHYDTVYDYGWINDYSWVPVTCSGSGKTFKCTGGYYVISGKHWGIVGSHQVYNGSTTPYYVGPYSKGSQSFGPCYDYKLDADMNSFGNKVEAGTTVSINAMVNNTPFTQPSAFYSYYQTRSKSYTANWQVSLLRLSSGQQPSTSFSKPKAQNNTSGCNYFDPTRSYSCTNSYADSVNRPTLTGSSIFWPGSSSATNISFNVPDVTAGTKYCFAFSVNDPSNSDMSQKWSHASFSYINNCIIVVKKPKVQVWGGDLYVGRGSYNVSPKSSKIQTSTSVVQNKLYGSWGEYGLAASSSIVGMASGSVFKYPPNIPGGNMNNYNNCNHSLLIITNAVSSSCTNATQKGYYSNSNLISNVSASFSNSAVVSYISGAVNVSGLSGINKNSSTNINITGGTIPLKKWVVINAPDATIKISGDIKYDTGTIKSLGDIPQLVIIANDINIEDNVTQIDSWLIAKGSINTCSSADITNPSLTIAKCNSNKTNKPLTINGPVMAGRLYLNRTVGAEPNGHTGDPAEVFNMRADAYLWSYARASENGSAARVVYSNEMPVRF